MRNFKIIITSFCLFTVGGIAFFSYKFNKLDTFKEKSESPKDLTSFLAAKLEKDWILGPSKNEIKECPNLDQNAPVKYYQCHIDYLKCILKKPLSFKNTKIKGRILNETKRIVEFKNQGKKFYFSLDNLCHMTYLPKSFYSAGINENEEFLWDNFHEDVYIDKFYVSNYEIKKWKPSINIKADYKANTTLSLKLKKEFCKDQGKSLLESRYFDAASFLPIRDSETGYFYKTNTHFKRGRTFLGKKGDLTLRNCLNAYIKGCERLLIFKNYEVFAQSWMGMSYALGGHEEVFINRYSQYLNFKTSSMMHPKDYKGHRVGYREKYKEQGAFRCMLRL